MKENKLVIIGAGGTGREIFHAALRSKKDADGAGWKPVAFVVEREFMTSDTIEGLEVVAFEDIGRVSEGAHFIVAIGDPFIRRRLVERVSASVPGAVFGTVIHESVVIMGDAVIEEGVFLSGNVTLTVGCRIRRHVVVTQGAAIGHDCEIGEFSMISPTCALSGNTRVGAMSFLGSGAILYPKVHIGERCVVGAGVVVSRNLKEGHKQLLKPNTMILPPE